MKRKSFVINLYEFYKKAVICTAVAGVTLTAFYFDIPIYIMDKMADTVFGAEESSDFSRIFSLNGEDIIENVIMYKPQKPIEKKEEDIPKPKEIVPETNSVDISKAKPSNAVTNNDIIVSNAPKKQFDTNELLNRPLNYTKTDGYKVLIIHTHTTESYLPNDRSNNENENMIRIGQEFAKVLNENGIKTLHCKTVHDNPYRYSYINQQKSLEKILSENPSIEVVIDVHRDALYDSNGGKLRPSVNINGESTAQVMLVCGTNASGLEHKTWESCFSFALKVQNDMNKNYPNLARPVNLRTERFNTHMTNNSVIFEVGSNGNTLSEAIGAAHYAAESVSNVILNK